MPRSEEAQARLDALREFNLSVRVERDREARGGYAPVTLANDQQYDSRGRMIVPLDKEWGCYSGRKCSAEPATSEPAEVDRASFMKAVRERDALNAGFKSKPYRIFRSAGYFFVGCVDEG